MDDVSKFGSVWLALTYNCNSRCRWCYASSNLAEYRNKQFDPVREDSVIELMEGLGAKDVKLLGGEPTVYKNIIQIVNKFYRRGFRLTLVTNGRRFSDYEFAQRMSNAGLSYASFSLEGHDSHTHDAETQVPGSFDEVMRGLDNALNCGIEIAINVTMARGNKDNLEKVVDLVEGKTKLISFNICAPWLHGVSDMSSVLSPREGAAVFERVYSYAKSKGLTVRLTTPTPLCNVDPELLRKMKQEGAVGGICSIIAGQNFVIDYNGDVLPCTLFSGFPMFNIFNGGRIMTAQEFLGTYNSPGGVAKSFRSKMGHYPSPKCTEKCHEFCTGGCPVFWKKFGPSAEVSGSIVRA